MHMTDSPASRNFFPGDRFIANLLPCSQFHQHFLSSFCADILATKNYKKLHKILLYKKGSRKMMMKSTPVRIQRIASPDCYPD